MATYEADSDYEVKLLKVVKIGHAVLRPDQKHVMKGSLIDDLLADADYGASALEVGAKVEPAP